ncbi:MAG: hypothetical protein ACI8UC_001534, partial [Psychromonas sp.]
MTLRGEVFLCSVINEYVILFLLQRRPWLFSIYFSIGSCLTSFRKDNNSVCSSEFTVEL